ncbi:alpha/beta hydrolase [Polystyrenella longa]|uniref:alpha/beta hydrolase n=1 Tax=Polystyrenella longa TaxID=2528007 RepID=UPI0011A00C11|nr:hypothetical protein [Polystyrenella longa]
MFTDPYQTIDTLCEAMVKSSAPSISLIGHSFGDWIARSAINQSQLKSIRKLISICPTVAPVPFAKVFKPIMGKLVPELVVMADKELMSTPLSEKMQIKRSSIWAKVEVIVTRPQDFKVDHEMWASHISSVFQPSVWRVIEEELSSN